MKRPAFILLALSVSVAAGLLAAHAV